MGLLGKSLIVFGVAITLIGVAIAFSPRIPFLGKLPGDFAFEIGNAKVFFPLATCLLLSLILSLILNVVSAHK